MERGELWLIDIAADLVTFIARCFGGRLNSN